MRIYVSGPYSAATEAERLANVERAMAAGRALLTMGHAPLIPHLNHWFEAWAARKEGGGLCWETYLRWDLELLAGCEALLFLGESPGADREAAHALALGLPVYERLADVPPGAPR